MVRFALASVVLATVTTGAISVSTSAATPGPAAETHCVIEVVDVLASGELVMSEPACFRTFGEATLFAAASRVEVWSGSEAITDSKVEALLASFTLGIHFDGYNGSGSSITVVGTSCIGGYWNTGTTWANRISSTYNGCPRLRHHDYANKGGGYGDTVGLGSVHNVPWWIDNKAESVSYWSA